MDSKMICSECGQEVVKVDETNWKPMDKLLDSSTNKVPFYCPKCGAIKSPLKAVRDLVLVYPLFKDPKKLSKIIELPEPSVPELTDYGVILSFGPGYYDRKRFHPVTDLRVGMKVIYDRTVPWDIHWEGTDKKTHLIKCMAYPDIKLIPKVK